MKSFTDYRLQNENKNAAKVNEDLIYGIRKAEKLEEYIIKALKLFENEHVQIVDYDLITDESKFETNKINVKYIKDKKSRKYDKRLPINDSRYDLLRVHYVISGKNKTKGSDPVEYVEKKDFYQDLLLFKRIKNYYYLINGTKSYPLYQMVDNLTYTTKDYLILKTLSSSITLKGSNTEGLVSVTGEKYYVPGHLMCFFRAKFCPILMYLATMGYENTLKYMEMSDIVRVESFRKYDIEKEYCFPSEGGLYVKVLNYFFDNDLFTQSIVYNFVNITEECTNMDDLNDINFWVCLLGSTMTNVKFERDEKIFKKGKSTIQSFSQVLDEITKEVIRLKDYNKASPYALLRWMMRNYNSLKAKDNMDLKNKRIRMSEYLSGYVIRRIAPRVYKFNSICSKDVTIQDVENLISMPQDFIIKTVQSSKKSLLRYDSSVNDQDLFTALKYTIKGLGAIGENSSNTVNIKYRGVHVSHLGRIDLNSSSNSDPGMSGIIVPFAKMYGKNNTFFGNEDEPQEWDDNFRALYNNYYNGENNPIYPLNYFYDKEKKSRKALRRLEDALYFVRNDPYLKDGIIALDVTKSKIKKIIIKKPKSFDDVEDEIKDNKTHKVKIKRKK